jgi:hypothetical protein
MADGDSEGGVTVMTLVDARVNTKANIIPNPNTLPITPNILLWYG